MRASVWTKPVIGRFEQLFNSPDRPSYEEIAQTLSREFCVTISRNAAIGFGKRHNMPKRKDPDKPRKREVRVEHPGKLYTPPQPYIAKAPIGKGRLRIEQLGPRSCRWPFGDRHPLLYCGCLSVEGHPYCEDHMRLGHVRWQATAVA